MPEATPAIYAAQLRCPRSGGTLTYWFVTGNVSWIMYSFSFSVLLSKESATFPNRAFQQCDETNYDHVSQRSVKWNTWRAPTIWISCLTRRSRWLKSSKILRPTLWPHSSSLHSRSAAVWIRVDWYCTISENRCANADRDTEWSSLCFMLGNRVPVERLHV